jgi:integrase
MPRARSRLFLDPPSPYWQAVWSDGAGRVHRQSTRCRDHGAAALWLATRELERVKEQAGIPVARHVSLDVASAEYVAEREPTWSKNWRDTVESFFRARVLPAFGEGRTVSTLTRADVERFRSTEIGRLVRGGEQVSPATVNRMMAALSAFGGWCLVEGRQYHTTNPWAGHEPLPEDELAIPVLEGEQLDQVLAALDNQLGPLPSHGRRHFRFPWRQLVEFSRETGLRRSELSRLACADLDLRTRTLIVVSSRRRGRTKSRKMRPVPLSPRALEVLELLPKRKDGLVWGKIPDGRRAFRTAAKAAGLERVWLHLFRHLFASRLAERGAGRADLRDAGGWSSSRMADRYTHSRMDRLRELVEGPIAGRTRGGAVAEKVTGGSELPEPPVILS